MLDVLHWDLLVEETPLCFVDKIGDPNLRRCAAVLSARALCESRMLAFYAELVAAAALQVASRQLPKHKSKPEIGKQYLEKSKNDLDFDYYSKVLGVSQL